MNVEIKEMPAFRVAAVRHVGSFMRISEAFGRLEEIAGKAGLFATKHTMLAIYRDDPKTTPEAELRADAGLTVSDDAQIPQGLTEQHLSAGRYAMTVHIGPYEKLGGVWSSLIHEWLPKSGQHMGEGPTYEIYRNVPAEVSKEQLRTELYLPLA